MKNYKFHCNGCNERFLEEKVIRKDDSTRYCPNCDSEDLIISNENGKFASDFSIFKNESFKHGSFSYLIDVDGLSHVTFAALRVDEEEINKAIKFLQNFKKDLKTAKKNFIK